MATLTLTLAASTDDAIVDGSAASYIDETMTINWGSTGGTNGNYGQGLRYTGLARRSARSGCAIQPVRAGARVP